MARVRLWLGAEMRRHWRRQLAIALAVGLAAAVVLALVAGSRRTASAYTRFDRSHLNPTLEIYAPPGMTVQQLRTLGRGPDVEAAGGHVPLLAAPDTPGVFPGQDFIVFAATDEDYGRSIDRPLIVSGRLPDPARIDEVFASVDTARALGLRIGSQVRLVSLPVEQTDAFYNGEFGKLSTTGPTPTVRVVGIGRTRLDLESVSYARKYFFATSAFATAYHDKMISFSAGILDVRLHSGRVGADAFMATLPREVRSNADFAAQALPSSSVRDTARVQAFALALVGFAAALAWLIFTLALVGRAAASMSDDGDVLAALGSPRRDRAIDVAVRFVPATIAAVVIAIGGAWLASSLFPSGPAGNLDVDPGRAFDGVVIATGAAAVATSIMLSALVLGFRGRASPRRISTKPPAMGRLRATSSPTLTTGLRWASPSVRESRRPARAALVGAVFALAAVVAGLTYSGAVEHLVSSPAAYGWAFDAQAGGQHPRDEALHNPAIGDVAIAHIVGTLALNGVDMQGYAFSTVRGPAHFTVIAGRQPVAPDEVLLGSASANALHVGIGDQVQGLDHESSAVALRVVGLGAFPTIETDSYRTGALLTPETLRRVGKSEGYDAVLFRFAPGVDHNAAARRMQGDQVLEGIAAPPGGVNDLREVRTYPLWLVAFVALLGLVAVANALIVTPHRRRTEIGELRALGMTARQIRRASAVQGATIAIVGIVVGIPLGVLTGRVAWAVHARSLGVVGLQIVPAAAAVAIAAGTLGVLTALAVIAGRTSRRLQPAVALRAQ